MITAEGIQFVNALLPLAGAVAGGFGAWVAVRVKIAQLEERLESHKARIDSVKGDLDAVNARVDRILQR